MKVRISRGQSAVESPVVEAYRAIARESLGPGRHRVVSVKVQYRSVENGPRSKDPGDASPKKIRA